MCNKTGNDFKDIPIGEVRKETGISENCYFLLQDGLKIYSDGCERVVKNYYKDLVVEKGYENHDFCYYCGYDNGIDGISRNGWDCGYCGGN